MEVFYSDKDKLFKCDIEIEGASIKESFVRLILEFDGGLSYMFKGKLTEDGKCKIKVPALKNVLSETGNATLEVIAENTFFESWTDKFKVKRLKNVKINIDEGVDDDDDLIDTTPKVNIIKEQDEISIPKFSDYYTDFIDNRRFDSYGFRNHTPTNESIRVVRKNDLNESDQIIKIFMYFYDKELS